MSSFQLRQAAGGTAAGPTDGKPKMPPGQWLQAHRYTVLAGGGVGVVALALYSRMKHSGDPAAAADPSSLNPNLSGQYADTTSTDIYNALEPLIERMSGFDGTSQLLGQGQSILDAINKLPKPAGGGTTSGGGSTGGTPAHPAALGDQFHQVGKVGATTTFDAYVRQHYPTATPTQRNAIQFWTILDPRNARFRKDLEANKIPGGAPINFVTPK